MDAGCSKLVGWGLGTGHILCLGWPIQKTVIDDH